MLLNQNHTYPCKCFAEHAWRRVGRQWMQQESCEPEQEGWLAVGREKNAKSKPEFLPLLCSSLFFDWDVPRDDGLSA